MKEILPSLNPKAQEPLYEQLYSYIKNEIESGAFVVDERLPSVRSLSAKLGVSITTIRTAYDQLLMEGYIRSKKKSGYLVNRVEFLKEQGLPLSKKDNPKAEIWKRAIYDEGCFDFVKWKKCIAHVLNYEHNHLLSEVDLQGEQGLRDEIARYVFQSRGVHCSGDDVVVGAGTQQLLLIVASILKDGCKSLIGFENPGYLLSENIFRAHNFRILHHDLDQEGVLLEGKVNPEIVYISPSHQFPTGIVMSAGRRAQLLNWANEHQGLLIEDDYDSELRYFGKPVPALKALDKNDRVVYLGSFASTLLPSIRISYMVLPKTLRQQYLEKKKMFSQGVSMVDQLTLQKFMEEGHYLRHIRRIRRLYSEKASALSDFILQGFGGMVEIVSNTSGLFIILKIKSKDWTEGALAAALQNEGIKATPYGHYVKKAYDEKEPMILLYFYNVQLKYLQQILKKILGQQK